MVSVVGSPGRTAQAAETSPDAPSVKLAVSRSQAAGDCPDEATLLQSALELGSPPASETANAGQPLLIEVSFERGDGDYSADLRVSGRKQGMRQLHAAGANCAPVAEATSIVVAMVLDRLPADASVLTLPPPLPEQLSPKPPAGPRVSDRQVIPAKLSVRVGVSGGLAYGMLGAHASGLLGIAVHGGARWWELGAGATWALPWQFTYSTGEIAVSAFTGRFDGCAWFTPGGKRFRAGGCAGLWLSALRGEGRGYDHDHTTTQLWPALAGGLVGRLSVAKHWALRLAGWGLVPFRRVTFSVEGVGTAFESNAWAVASELGPELTFE